MLKVTREEFLCMKALVLFSISESAQRRSEIEILQPHFFSFLNEMSYSCCLLVPVLPVPVEGLKSQRCFDELRTSYIKELDRLASHSGETTRTQRLFQLTQLLDYLQTVNTHLTVSHWNLCLVSLKLSAGKGKTKTTEMKTIKCCFLHC